MHFANLQLADVRGPAQSVRASIDEVRLAELADDVRENGVLVPIIVKEVDGGYEVVDGDRRFRASIIAKKLTIPANVLGRRETNYDARKLTANLFRQEMSAVEEAAFFAEKFDELGSDVDKVCRAVGKKRGYVEERLLLLSGDAKVLNALAAQQIGYSVARELNAIRNESRRHYYLDQAVQLGATQKLVHFWRGVSNSQPDGVEPSPAGPTAVASVPATAIDFYICWICGAKEPVWDLKTVMIHSACERVTMQRAGITEGANNGSGATDVSIAGRDGDKQS